MADQPSKAARNLAIFWLVVVAIPIVVVAGCVALVVLNPPNP
jgi:hypothetical protein